MVLFISVVSVVASLLSFLILLIWILVLFFFYFMSMTSGLSILLISKNQLLVSLIYREALKTFLHWGEGILKWTSQYLNLNLKETVLSDNCSLSMAVSICILYIQVHLCWLHIYLYMYNFILDWSLDHYTVPSSASCNSLYFKVYFVWVLPL